MSKIQQKTIKKYFNKDLIERSAKNLGDINKFCFMLRKGVYPYEYMDT